MLNTASVVDPVTILVVILGDVIVCTPVNVCAASVLAIVAFVVGKVYTLVSVPAKVIVLLTVSFLPVAATTL